MDADLIGQREQSERAASGDFLSPPQLYQHDPLLILLKDKLHLNNLWISVGALLLPGCTFLSWWVWWAGKTQLWVLDDTLSVLLQTFVLFPFIFFLYLFIPVSIADLFNTLKANGVIGEPRHQADVVTYEAFVQRLVTWMDRIWWTVVILIIVGLYALYRLLLLEPGSPSPVPYWMRVCAIIIYLPLMYATGMSVVRLLLALIFTNWLFLLFNLRVKPLYPDDVGGLGPLGHLLWVCVGIMLWEALLLVATVLSRNLHWLSLPEMLLLSGIYVVLTPALLLGWLILPHRAMVSARNEALQPLTDAYQQIFAQSLLSEQHDHDTRTIVADTRRLVILKQRYDLVSETFPVWPLNIGTLSRIGVTIILPLILPLLTSLITFTLHLFGLSW